MPIPRCSTRLFLVGGLISLPSGWTLAHQARATVDLLIGLAQRRELSRAATHGRHRASPHEAALAPSLAAWDSRRWRWRRRQVSRITVIEEANSRKRCSSLASK